MILRRCLATTEEEKGKKEEEEEEYVVVRMGMMRIGRIGEEEGVVGVEQVGAVEGAERGPLL